MNPNESNDTSQRDATPAPFEFEGNKVRAVLDENGDPMFVASDIAKILGYGSAKDMARTLDADDKGTHEVPTLGGPQKMTVLTESGLYSAILSREVAYVKEPEAQSFVKRFQRWVTHEVLPQIRRTGGYIPLDGFESDEQVMARALKIADRTLAERDRTIAAQAKQIDEQRPKVLFADAVAASDGTCLVGELAKMLRQNGVQVGQNRLFARLREDGYLGKAGQNRNVPTQKAMERGLFRIKETAVTHSDGHVTISRTAKVTGAGQRFFIDLYGTGAKPLDGLEASDEAR